MPQPLRSSSSGGSPPSLPSKSKEKFLSLILKAVIMMLLICFFFLILPLASFLLFLPLVLRHRRHRLRQRRYSRLSYGFSVKQLRKLPQLRFSQETTDGHSESDTCAICLDEFNQGQWCRNLVGCGHLFHRRCLDSWLIQVTSCPICRTRVCLDDEGPRSAEFQGLLDL
ncbi:putative clathrin assembly protein [Hibiscus syriacus]|uniref:RING-type E3 ubiquitin transferase n=1 Tax=Hibiscus syriacus TaxID=106335 RepID=A0A6A2YEB5_HIBSY|nr:RING-H2 finger protein ATL56-like [Hibiscus syriacus]KAE8671054.1 putative clathrin assembly protein [Hibiscus syriacus]